MQYMKGFSTINGLIDAVKNYTMIKRQSNNPRNSKSMDEYDRMILDVLCVDGRISMSDLAKRINLSKTPTRARVQRLQDEGYIVGYRAIVDPVRMGLDHIAFVEVTVSETTEHALEQFNQAIAKISEIEQCHMIAGNFDYLLKVRTQSMPDYRRVLGEKISSLPYVAHTKTFMAMESVKEEAIRSFL